MSCFKISNQIFSFRLNAQEMSVYAYLCSLPATRYLIGGEKIISVKQSTITQKCRIKAVQTVAKIIARLAEKGLAEPVERSVKANRYKGTYSYSVKVLPTEKEYFFVDRYIFGNLIPRQIMIYLFICKSYSPQLNDSWNSYNDISEQTGMKRETVIKTIRELSDMKFIVRCRRKAKTNKRVFVDNHYQIIFYVRGTFKGIKTVRLHREYNRTKKIDRPLSHFYDSTFLMKCQEVFQKFFLCRGSPSD